LAPAGEYVAKPLMLEIFSGDSVEEDDHCLNSHPENRRAYENTIDYYKLRF
jgi:hypothetical protein